MPPGLRKYEHYLFIKEKNLEEKIIIITQIKDMLTQEIKKHQSMVQLIQEYPLACARYRQHLFIEEKISQGNIIYNYQLKEGLTQDINKISEKNLSRVTDCISNLKKTFKRLEQLLTTKDEYGNFILTKSNDNPFIEHLKMMATAIAVCCGRPPQLGRFFGASSSPGYHLIQSMINKISSHDSSDTTSHYNGYV